MRAVAVAVICILTIADRIEPNNCSASELGMGPPDSRVDDVDVHTGTGSRVRVCLVEWQVTLAGTGEPPGRVALSYGRFHYRIFFDQLYPRVSTQLKGLLFRHFGGKAVDRVREYVGGMATVLARKIAALPGGGKEVSGLPCRIYIQDHDVVACDR